MVGGSVDSGRRELSENILFVWAKTLYNGEKVRCCACDTRTDKHVQCSALGRIRNIK